MTKFRVGDRVELHNSGERVTITSIIDDFTFLILHDDKNPQIVKKSQIKKARSIPSEVPARAISGKNKKKDGRFLLLEDRSGEDKLYLALERTIWESEEHFIPYLVNKSGSLLEIAIHITHGNESHLDDEFKLPAYRAVKLRYLNSSLIIVSPRIRVIVKQYFVDGTREKDEFKSRLSHKLLKQKPGHDPSLNKEVIIKLIEFGKQSSTDDLKAYAESLAREKQGNGTLEQVNFTDPSVMAEFDPRIDLHLDKLVDNPENYTPAGAFKLQLKKLNEHIEQAYIYGKDPVVIHGKGKGRLKSEIEIICRNDSRIRGYFHEYHGGETTIYFV